MKILVKHESDDLIPLSHHLKLEGNELVTDEQSPELIISESNSGIHDKRFVYSNIKFPHLILKALGLDILSSKTSYFFTKWYDYEKGWSPQLFLGIPVHGLMDGGLGAPEVTACCGRYVEGYNTPTIFQEDVLKGFLNDLNCKSFVSVEYSHDHEIVSIRTGVPFNGLYNLLEGVKGSIGEFLLDPFQNRLIESWTTNLLVTRHPFPAVRSADKITIHHVTPEVEKHVWFFDVVRFRRAISTTDTKVACVTAWGVDLFESNKRALRTAFGLNIPYKQFRLDAFRSAGEVYDRLAGLGVV